MAVTPRPAAPRRAPRPERLQHPQIEQHHLHRAVPTLTVVHNAEKAECGHGVCPLSPSCTRRCYLTEAHRSLRQSIAEREAQLAEPPDVEIDRRLRRRVAIGLALYALAFVSLAVWLFV